MSAVLVAHLAIYVVKRLLNAKCIFMSLKHKKEGKKKSVFFSELRPVNS